MSFSGSITFKTITRLEYADEQSLLGSIQESLYQVHIYHVRVKELQAPGSVYTHMVYRRERNADSYFLNISRKEFNFQESFYSLPEGETFTVLVDIDDRIFEKNAHFGSSMNTFLQNLCQGRMRFGKNITLGCGICVLVELSDSFFGGNTALKEESTKDLCSYHRGCAHMEIAARTDKGILIRNHNREAGKPYAVNKEGDPIIPATTWKGIFRSAISQWVNYYHHDPSLISEMFGERSTGTKGNLIFYDTVIRNPVFIPEKRAHLDKLTNRIMYLKENVYIAGSFTIEIDSLGVLDLYKPYIELALRDLDRGRLNVGADFGLGKGLVRIDRIEKYYGRPLPRA